jgi:hypothetical protein
MDLSRSRHRRPLAVASVTAAAASTSSPTTQIYQACSTTSHVLSPKINGQCPAGTHAVAISAKGATGAVGAAGPTGAAGAGSTGAPGIAGPNGTNGNGSVTSYARTISTPDADSTTPATATPGVVGPFTITGACYLTSGSAVAQTVVATTQDHSALSDHDSHRYINDWLAANQYNVGNTASGSAGSPQFAGPADGTTSVKSGDGTSLVNLFPGNGACIGSAGGATVPACTFFGRYNHYTPVA